MKNLTFGTLQCQQNGRACALDDGLLQGCMLAPPFLQHPQGWCLLSWTVTAQEQGFSIISDILFADGWITAAMEVEQAEARMRQPQNWHQCASADFYSP